MSDCEIKKKVCKGRSKHSIKNYTTTQIAIKYLKSQNRVRQRGKENIFKGLRYTLKRKLYNYTIKKAISDTESQ